MHSLGGELTNLVGEWLEEEKLKAIIIEPSPTPPGPLAENTMEADTASTRASEQQPMVKETIASNPLLVAEKFTDEVTLKVMGVQLLINLEEEPVATDAEEEPEVNIDAL